MTFDDAVRQHFGVGPDVPVGVEISGGGTVQIGDYTWDTEPHTFELWAGDGLTNEIKSQSFDTLPDLLNALMESEE